MDTTRLQRNRINNILQQEIVKGMYEILKSEGIQTEFNIENDNPINDMIAIRRTVISRLASWHSQNTLERIDEEVHNSNAIISKVRGTIRKLRRWTNREGFDNKEHDYMEGYNLAVDEILGLTKKILVGQDNKFYHQFKSCMKCKYPIDGMFTPSHRGVLCSECVPIQTADI